ncbi:MAG: hypothetical protein Q9184_005279 [Pyrenodesmia sp. 2 TL-2023]
MSPPNASIRGRVGGFEGRGRGRGGLRVDVFRARQRAESRDRVRGTPSAARSGRVPIYRPRESPDLVRDDWRGNYVASRGRGRRGSLGGHASESSIPLHRRHRIYLSMDEPREQSSTSRASHGADGDHDRNEPHPFPSGHSSDTENRPDPEGEYHDTTAEPDELIDALDHITEAPQDYGYQPFIVHFVSPPPRKAPITPTEAAVADAGSTAQLQTSTSSERVSDPEATVKHNPKTEALGFGFVEYTTDGKSPENSVDAFFDALQATEAAEIEAVRQKALDRFFPPLAPEIAALPRPEKSAAALEPLIDLDDDEASRGYTPGSEMMDSETGEGCASSAFGGVPAPSSYDSTSAPGKFTDLAQDQDNSLQSDGRQLPAGCHAPLSTPSFFNGKIIHRAGAETAHKEQVEKHHPLTEQGSPDGEPAEPAASKEMEDEMEQVSEEQAQKVMGRQHKKNRKTKAKLKRRRAEKAQREAEMSNHGGGAGDIRLATGVETSSRLSVQVADMPTPAVQLAEDLTPTNSTVSPVADGGLNDPISNRQAGPNDMADEQEQMKKKSTRRRTKGQGQGARQRKKLRELCTGKPQEAGVLISFDHD